MRFSFWPGPMQPWDELLFLARHIERTGWDGFWFADHFMPDSEDTSAPWSEAWTTLAGIAAAVPRIRVGPLVTGNTYRHPAVLAKMAATVDHISGGRVILGLGAGWQENEHTAYGIPFHTTAERLARLDESCQVIRALFREKRTTFAGKFYQLADAPLEPKPVSDPLPLLVGGGGEKVTLRIVAKHADAWNVWGTPETLRAKSEILDRHCADVGRDPGEIARTAVALLFLSDDADFITKIRKSTEGQHVIVGGIEEVSETIGRYRDVGVGELIVPDFTLGPRDRKLETLDRFIEEVAPRFR
jgi:F420-dependent oxidoreductase-like protein